MTKLQGRNISRNVSVTRNCSHIIRITCRVRGKGVGRGISSRIRMWNISRRLGSSWSRFSVSLVSCLRQALLSPVTGNLTVKRWESWLRCYLKTKKQTGTDSGMAGRTKLHHIPNHNNSNTLEHLRAPPKHFFVYFISLEFDDSHNAHPRSHRDEQNFKIQARVATRYTGAMTAVTKPMIRRGIFLLKSSKLPRLTTLRWLTVAAETEREDRPRTVD